MDEQPGSRSIYSLLVERPVATIMAFLAALVFGFVSYQSLALNLMPDLDYPTLTVRTEYAGAAPGEVESQVSRPIEESLSTVPGLASLESVSRAGMSDVILEFDWDSDMTDLSQSVRERIALLDLGDEVGRPLVLRYDPELDPILRIAMGGKDNSARGLVALRRLAEDEIKRSIETLPGVAAVKVLGGLEREVTVEVNEGLLHARGFTLGQLVQRLQQENINLAGGSLLEGQTEYLIRTLNEFKSPKEIEDLYLFGAEGQVVRIGEVAQVVERTRDREVVGRLAGAEAVEIAVFREADANIVNVSTRVKNAIFGSDTQRAWIEKRDQDKKKADEEAKEKKESDAVAEADATPKAKDGKGKKKGGDKKKGKGKKRKRPSKRNPTKGMGGGGDGNAFIEKQMTNFLMYDLPEGSKLTVVSDQAKFIEAAISDVRSTALIGALLAIIVLFVFLRHGWTTFLVGVAIPISVIVTFAPMYLFGVSLNLMSLGGLALCIGMLVDNSIVVLESVHRCREEGDEPLQAAIRGTTEVAGAVFASTLTTVAVFFPIAFVTGVAGQLFGHLALTVVFGLLASLAVALFLVPVLAALPAKIELSRHGGAGSGPALAGGGAGIGYLPRPLLFLFESWADTKSLFRWVGTEPRWRAPARLVGLPIALMFVLARTAVGFPVALVFRVGFFVTRLFVQWTSWIREALRWGGSASDESVFDRAFGAFGSAYTSVLRAALRRPTYVLVPAIILFVGALRFGSTLGTELLPEVHQGVFLARVALPVGSPLERTLELVDRMEKGVARLDGIDSVYTSAGAEQDLGSSADRGANTAEMTIRLEASEDPEALELQVREDLRTWIEQEFDSVDLRLTAPTLFSLRTPLEVEVRGRDLDELRTAADEAVEVLSALPGLRDVRSNLQSGYPEVQIRYDRERLSRYQLDVGAVARAVRDKVKGNVATFLRGGTQKTDIRVVLREGDRETTADLAALNINPAGVPAIRLDAVAELIRATGPSEIRRSDQERAALITADLVGFDLGSAAEDVDTALSGLRPPNDVHYEVGGQSREMEQSLGSLQFALILAVFLVYIIMASQFESVTQPLVILFALPLAVVGVIPALALFDVSISVIVLIGGIVLAGVVVNNAIVLVDYANQLRQRGMALDDAIVQAGSVRLRPIIISTLTTVLGLMPMVLGVGEGSEIRRPLALTIIAGLSSSTVLTLGVIPVLYGMVSRLRPLKSEQGPTDE